MFKFIEDLKTKYEWPEVAKIFEDTYNIGIDIFTNKSKKQLYTTNRNIKIQIRIINKIKFELTHSKDFIAMNMYNLQQDFFIYNHKTLQAYNKNGYSTFDKIDKNDFMPIKYEDDDLTDTLEIEYNNRINKIDEIYKYFNIEGRYYKDTLISRILFYHLTGHYIHNATHCNEEEFNILQGTKNQIVYARKNFKFENGFKIDINSFYPYCMSSKEFKIPITTGRITKVNKIDDLNVCGKYKIDFKTDNLLIKRSDNKYYTNHEIKVLELLNIKYTLCDDENNALIYDECLTGDKAFYYFNDLYNMKNNGNKYAKLIMNSTWGNFSRLAEYEITMDEYENNIDKYENKQLRFNSNDTITVKDEDKHYRFIIGRMKSFLMGYTRYKLITDYINKIDINNIVLINTDALLIINKTREELEKIFTFSKSMGHLKIEKEYNGTYEVINFKTVIKI